MTTLEIAKKFDVSPQRVSQIYRAAKVAGILEGKKRTPIKPPGDPETIERIRKYISEGTSIRDTCKEVGMSYSKVRIIVKDNSIEFPKVRASIKVSILEVLKELFDGKKNLNQISKSMGVSYPTVYNTYQKAIELGIPIPLKKDGRKDKS